jgi:transcriptional regulator with XRE-family HTH domain
MPCDMTGEELVALRRKRGMKAYEFARLLGIGVTTLSRYERGHKPIPRTVNYAARWVALEETPGQRLVAALKEALEPSGG